MYICISIFISFLIQQLYVFNVEHLLVSCIHYLCTSFTCLIWVKLCSSFSGNEMLAHLQEYAHLFYFIFSDFWKWAKQWTCINGLLGWPFPQRLTDSDVVLIATFFLSIFLISSFHSHCRKHTRSSVIILHGSP